MKKIVFILLIVLCLQIYLFPSEEVEGLVIHKIHLKGLNKAKAKDVYSTIYTEEGSRLDLNLIDKDYQNLFALGYFDEIFISTEKAYDNETNMAMPGMVDIIFEFIEKPTIRKTIFKGNDNLAFAKLLEGIQIKRGDFLNTSIIHSDITVLKDKYNEKGFPYTKIDYEIFTNEELKDKNQVDVIFNIKEGLETYIKEIIIEGNENVNDTTLKTKMKTKERKLFGLIKGVFEDNKFYQDIEDLINYYRDLGYYFVDIQEPEINRYEIEEVQAQGEAPQKVEVISIKLKINEGDRYRYGGMELSGNKIFTDEDLTYNQKLKKGNIFNYSKYQETVFALRKKYTDSGYVQTIINDESVVDKENKVISIKINIIESKQSYVEAVYFRGNEKTKTYILERTVVTEVGEIFNSSKLMDSMILLHNLGFFSNVNYEIQPGSAPGLLKIIYLVEEQLTAEVKFGLQIPANDQFWWGITLFTEIGEKNFLGRDLQIKGKVDGSINKQGFTFDLQDPWFLNYPWSLGTNVTFYHYWHRNILRKLDKEHDFNFSDDWDDPNEQNDKRTEYSNDVTDSTYNKNYLNANGDAFEMGYHELEFNIGANTGYRFLKYFHVSGAFAYKPKYVFMTGATNSGPNDPDNPLQNPEYIADPYLRWLLSAADDEGNDLQNDGGYGSWRHRLTFSSTFGFKTTRRRIHPYQGIKFNFTTIFNFIHYDSIKFKSGLTFYLTLLDVNFGGNWPFKNVLVFNSNIEMIFQGLQVTDYDEYKHKFNKPVLDSSDYILIDGLFSGRGWANSIAGSNIFNIYKGYAKLDFTLEYRLPIHDQIIWLAGFIDFFNLIIGPPNADLNWQWWNTTEENFPDYQPLGIDNWYGSVGVGIELTFPQLPLSFFVVKRFKLNYYSGLEWQTNPSTGDLSFILSMVGVYF